MSLTLKNITKRDGAQTHIYDTSLELEPGAFNILLGTTLSGKTTLMQIMAGLEKPTSGEVWFDGKNVTGTPVQKRNVAMVHQQFINYPNFTVFENIASPLRVKAMPAARIRDKVHEVAELLQLTPMLERPPSQLSGGQQQRTAIARALVKEAELVLLDEPLANLDFKLREELREQLPPMFAERRCTVVYATTEPGEALLLGGYTATLHEGRVTQFGRTGDVYRHPGDLISARVFSDPPINVAAVTRRARSFHLGDTLKWAATGPARALTGGDYQVTIRPHHLSPEKSTSKSLAVTGKVLVTELSGSESVVHFSLAGTTWVAQFSGIRAYQVGDEATFYLNPERFQYFSASDQLVAA